MYSECEEVSCEFQVQNFGLIRIDDSVIDNN